MTNLRLATVTVGVALAMGCPPPEDDEGGYGDPSGENGPPATPYIDPGWKEDCYEFYGHDVPPRPCRK